VLVDEIADEHVVRITRLDAPQAEIADVEADRVPAGGRRAADLPDLRERGGRREQQNERDREHETFPHRRNLHPGTSMLGASPAGRGTAPGRARLSYGQVNPSSSEHG
jgi:hypothetical protein